LALLSEIIILPAFSPSKRLVPERLLKGFIWYYLNQTELKNG